MARRCERKGEKTTFPWRVFCRIGMVVEDFFSKYTLFQYTETEKLCNKDTLLRRSNVIFLSQYPHQSALKSLGDYWSCYSIRLSRKWGVAQVEAELAFQPCRKKITINFQKLKAG